MIESNLIKISLILSLVGIVILILISDKIKIKDYQINELSKEVLEKEVTVSGKIVNIKETPGLEIITISDNTKPIKVVLFKDENKIQLKKGQEIEVTGKLKIYQKDFEIEAKEIKII